MNDDISKKLQVFLCRNKQAREEISEAVRVFLSEKSILGARNVGEYVISGDKSPTLSKYIESFGEDTELAEKLAANGISWFVEKMIAAPMLSKVDGIGSNYWFPTAAFRINRLRM